MRMPDGTGQARRREDPPLIIRAGGRQWVVDREGHWYEGDGPQRPGATPGSPRSSKPVRAAGVSERGPAPGREGRWQRGVLWLADVLDRLWTPGEADPGPDGPRPPWPGSNGAATAASGRAAATAVGRAATAAAGRSRLRRRGRVSRRRLGLRDAFRAGLVFGMGLGCLSMVLFHQLKPDWTPSALPAEAAGAGAVPTISVAGPELEVPAVRLYVLAAGSFGTQAEADKRRQELAKAGIQTVVHTGSTVQLWVDAALRPSSLEDERKALEQKGVHGAVEFVGWNAHAVRAPAGANQDAVRRVDDWLSAAVGSLHAATGALSDGGLRQDAKTAQQTADGKAPSAAELSETGYRDRLEAFRDNLRAAVGDLGGSSAQQSRLAMLRALDALTAVAAGGTPFTNSR
ncbi:hypothetical protein [Alicyclobacillus sp.]|uniref:hypothetical protein n=1 Tax=Alicyclobacillus sp. TaxID=61169 RepID=UPI0025BCB095|nr:hypothetical protein [Alicyclobacillus sp.]MCL6516152.1 hypothetical protein [Alicyclobacillus sp.]